MLWSFPTMGGKMITLLEFATCLKAGEIPPGPPEGSSPQGRDWGSAASSRFRSDITARGMWAIVDRVWTKALADWIGERTCLEIMAGAGWLAKALSDYGIDIIATDNGEWDERHSKIVFVHKIERLNGLESVKKYKDRDILIASWPPYEDLAICHICKEWGSEKPIIYIGEESEGCTATDKFFEHFQQIENQPHIPLMAWGGLHDTVIIGHYR